MSTYINDYNNVEGVTNDSTKLNATNVGNLIYKVDELQEQVALLNEYKHKTLIANSKDSWASKSWISITGGTYANDTTNYYQNGQSAKMTGASEDDGIHLEKAMDLTAHSDGFASTTDDIITIWLYVDSTSLTRLTTPPCELQINFHMDAYDTFNNYWYIQPLFEQIKAGVNVLKYRKSEFSEVGTGDWSNVQGISMQIRDDDPTDSVDVNIDSIMMHGLEFVNFIQKSATETVNNSSTMQNDDDFVVTLPPNGEFKIELFLCANAASSNTPDIKLDWATTGDVTFPSTRKCRGPETGTTSVTNTNIRSSVHNSGTDVSYGVTTTTGLITEVFTVQTADDGGNLQLRWAQNSATAENTNVTTSSMMFITRIK